MLLGSEEVKNTEIVLTACALILRYYGSSSKAWLSVTLWRSRRAVQCQMLRSHHTLWTLWRSWWAHSEWAWRTSPTSPPCSPAPHQSLWLAEPRPLPRILCSRRWRASSPQVSVHTHTHTSIHLPFAVAEWCLKGANLPNLKHSQFVRDFLAQTSFWLLAPVTNSLYSHWFSLFFYLLFFL